MFHFQSLDPRYSNNHSNNRKSNSWPGLRITVYVQICVLIHWWISIYILHVFTCAQKSMMKDKSFIIIVKSPHETSWMLMFGWYHHFLDFPFAHHLHANYWCVRPMADAQGALMYLFLDVVFQPQRLSPSLEIQPSSLGHGSKWAMKKTLVG